MISKKAVFCIVSLNAEKNRFAWFGDNVAASYAIVFLVAAIVYIITCAPGVLWQDSGLYHYKILNNDFRGNLGLALAHPLHRMLGIAVKYLVPVGDLAHRLNLMSAVFGALAVANLFLLMRIWLGKVFPAIISAISLLLAWTFWQHSVICEVYTLFAALMFAELIMVLKYIRTERKIFLFILAGLNGLGFANHMLAGFVFICSMALLVTLLLKKKIRVIDVVMMAAVWMICAFPFEYIFFERLIQTGDLGGTMSSALFGDLWREDVLNISLTPKIILENFLFIGLNFPTPNFLFLFVGIYAAFKSRENKAFVYITATILVMYFVFAFRYTIAYRFAFFLPFYCIAAIFIGVGVNSFIEKHKSKQILIVILLFALLPIPTYFASPVIARKAYPSLAGRRQRPYRDEYTFFLRPWKTGYNGAERFARESLEVAEKDSLIYADTTTAHAILYIQQFEGTRNDVMVVSDYDWSKGAPELNEGVAAKYVNESALYVVSPMRSYCPVFLLENYDFEQLWPIYKVVPKK